MKTPSNSREWRETLRAIGEAHDREDRTRSASLGVSERLTRGVEISMFAAKLREAFRDKSVAR